MINAPEKRSFRNAFLAAMAVNILLAGGFAAMWWRSHANPHNSMAPHAENLQAETGGSPSADMSEPPMSPIQISPQRLQSIGVRFGKVEYKTLNDQIRVQGNVEVDEKNVAYIQVRFPGWIRKLYANATYQYLRKGQPLFTIYSPDLVATEHEYLLARSNERQLQNSTVSGVASGAKALVGASRERLQQWQVAPAEIEKLESTGEVITDLTFDSPVSGYITEKNALPNMYVQPETKLYTVADLATVWVYANVFQSDLGRIKPGGLAEVTVDSYPNRSFRGRVDQILPQVDMNTRTARVRLVFANPGMKLSPGMFVNVVIHAPLGRRLVAPAGAVLQSGTRQIAFLNHGDGNLEPREIQTEARIGEEFIVTKGLKAGDSVVTTANFLIDSEAQLQAAAGTFEPPPPGAGMAAQVAPRTSGTSSAAITSMATLDFSSNPSPVHKGRNIFRVKVSSAQGVPITGAQVNITFFMAAMPGMGMPAMKSAVVLNDKGGGTYEGQGELESGGTWQVTITASRNGESIGRKQFSLNAEGGM
ncbi:MAG TPA: efflux RND transporter periplasmic adaptor subunit [Candidatus Saccharimonadales bacterium]|jgi:RND family efflux transporter MFP subunit|nr:efflux RND transporter periplasmic adaptor subunit [Candidatus Saccharimonadales bacterium]